MNSEKDYYQLYLKYKGKYLAEQKKQMGGGDNWYIYYNKNLLTINEKQMPVGWYLIKLIDSKTCPSGQKIKTIYTCANPPNEKLLTNFVSSTIMKINNQGFTLLIDDKDAQVCRRILDNPYLNIISNSNPNIYIFHNQNTVISRYLNIPLGQLTITTISSQHCNNQFNGQQEKISQIKYPNNTELNITPEGNQVCLQVLVDQYIRKLKSEPIEDTYSHLQRNLESNL
jgi:hypothetical protein